MGFLSLRYNSSVAPGAPYETIQTSPRTSFLKVNSVKAEAEGFKVDLKVLVHSFQSFYSTTLGFISSATVRPATFTRMGMAFMSSAWKIVGTSLSDAIFL